MEFCVLGPVEVRTDGTVLELRRQKQRALLAMLLLHAGEWLSADALIEGLWGERSPKTARSALQNYVAQLRRTLGRELIVSREGGYVLELSPEQLDLGKFERLLEDGREAEGQERVAKLREAVHLWRGPALADVLWEPFADHEAARLEELHISALEELVDAELALGAGGELVERLEALIPEHPYRERLRGQLMLALYRDGRQAEALDCYRRARRTLVEELGIEPGAALRELEQAILRQEPDLDAPHPDLAAALPLAERRKNVTVLFVELLFSERLDPELLHEASVGALTRVRHVLERHGATIEQRASEELLCVFGLPLAHEDDALRAARAALELQDKRAEYAVRVGIESGEVLAGIDDAGHGFVTGAVVPTARHLLELARPGEVLVGEGSLQLLGSAVQTEALHGRRDGCARLMQVEERIEATASTPLADRRKELEELHGAFSAVVDQRRGRLLLLLGEAGIGKTRLAAKLTAELEGRTTIARGRCLSYGQALSYWPLVEALRSLGAPARTALARLVEGGASSPRQLAWTVQQALAQPASERPLLLLIEDLHWAEAALLELLDGVCELSDGDPILILCLTRPELLERHPDWAQQHSIRLGPLHRAHAAALLRALSQPPGPPQRHDIIARAAGNPLFLEELSAFMVQGGGTAELPPRLQVLLQARLDLLPEPERLVLSCAALEGTVFHQGALEELLPAHSEVASRLEALAATLLIQPCPGELEGERGYRFRHQLICDTAYRALPKAERARLHECFANWLGRHRGRRAELEDVGAYHLEQAALTKRELEAADPTLERRAADALAAAAERAAIRTDLRAAAALCRRALNLLREDDARVPELELELATALVWDGEYEEAWALLERAARRAPEPRVAAGIRLARLSVEVPVDPDSVPAARIRRACAEAIPIFEDAGDHRALARAWFMLAMAELGEAQMGAFAQAMATAADNARRAGDRALEANALGARVFGAGLTCISWAAAAAELEGAAARFPGEPFIQGILVFCRVCAAYHEGGLGHARTLAEPFDRMRRAGYSIDAGLFTAVAGYLECLAGGLEEGEALILAGIGELEQHGERTFLCSVKALLARIRLEQDRYEAALELVDEAEQLGGPHDRLLFIEVNGLRARTYARLGEIEEARAAAEKAVAGAGTTDSVVNHATAQWALAEALAAAGELETALAAARKAERLFARLERTLERKRVRASIRQIKRERVRTGESTDLAASHAEGGD